MPEQHHQSPCMKNMQQKHLNFRKTTRRQNNNNAKPQTPLTKSMPTVDCYSNQSLSVSLVTMQHTAAKEISR
jgi:hypothetical protein